MGGIANAGKSKRPINVKFEIPYFTTSGIQVRYLKIIEPKVCIIDILSAIRVRDPQNVSSAGINRLPEAFKITFGASADVWFSSSCNIHRYLGYATLHNRETSQCDYRKCKLDTGSQ